MAQRRQTDGWLVQAKLALDVARPQCEVAVRAVLAQVDAKGRGVTLSYRPATGPMGRLRETSATYFRYLDLTSNAWNNTWAGGRWRWRWRWRGRYFSRSAKSHGEIMYLPRLAWPPLPGASRYSSSMTLETPRWSSPVLDDRL
ncbi:hypothetical protein H112_02001 [Trichophyton rubrum D6]|uniref:Uncharacterized protein n=3 Tax=Trichophyton TaxID=5550 RepID=A0A178EYY4_TRIRU|nr:hypothetical protein H100_01997 [Trichophyton rubrum MR850]EZF44769.1 hypothetical protein H102_01995 [Trichophyton rubrum CBS 100081]EZF55369.1 hypothetical protein H103_02006 [Trichophyton rubrum CBS 288.86]EZF65986.1 hypothetical protein H104_01981 [Trichophyton rubrum CBS 289.86]EZF76655.1 hypothetical protein H105_02011 [Trichophyton soudanense CBS 452.61]EZF87288.1 hypothetical protein H110_02005 [Trichophyton rubrum MR1448]EZF98008.1 hypothetical protein H113_02004 [Trichophyton rub